MRDPDICTDRDEAVGQSLQPARQYFIKRGRINCTRTLTK